MKSKYSKLLQTALWLYQQICVFWVPKDGGFDPQNSYLGAPLTVPFCFGQVEVFPGR